ncbi:MAG: hypothetical protein KDK70_35560 [Myxococcales bacterium]|nr:hypothetical protein [Myxococcales bacterium]
MQIPQQGHAHHERNLEIMLSVERYRRGEPPLDSTAWGRGSALEVAAPPCVACGDHEQVCPDLRCGGVPFCDDCSWRARNLTEWDDLGYGG